MKSKNIEVRKLKAGIVHEVWKDYIKNYLEKNGFRVSEEFRLNGKRVDLVVGRTAIEIESGIEHYKKNIEKCLEAGFERVIIFSIDKKIRFVDNSKVRIINSNTMEKYLRRLIV